MFRAVLNICFVHKSRWEITTAIQSTVKEFLPEIPEFPIRSPPETEPLKSPKDVYHDSPTFYPKNITINRLEKQVYTAEDPPLDIILRTSAVRRLSNFMLWQCHQHTQIFFLKCLWPGTGAHDLLMAIWDWQRRQKQRKRLSEGA